MDESFCKLLHSNWVGFSLDEHGRGGMLPSWKERWLFLSQERLDCRGRRVAHQVITGPVLEFGR
jgi:hypothetical protein